MAPPDGILTVLPAPEGYVVDFDNPQRKGVPETYFLVGFGMAISLAFFLQRIYTKAVIMRKFHFEDIMFVGSWACCVTVQALCLRLYASGVMGVHAWEISIEKYSNFSLLVMLSSAVYAPGTCMAKLSLLLFYFNLTPQRWFRYACIFMICVVIGGYSGIFFSLIFACHPIQRSWDLSVEGTCINTPALYIATAGLGVSTDVILLGMPIPIVLGLQLKRGQKLGLIFLFLVGSLTFITSVVRLVLLFPMLKDFDQPWAVVDPFTWIDVEANLLIICASLSTLRKFLHHVFPKLAADNSAADYSKNNRSDLVTFGAGSGRGTKKRYAKFDDDMYTLNTYNAVDIESAGNHDDSDHIHRVRESKRVEDESHEGDGDSAKAILRTRTATVVVERRTDATDPLGHHTKAAARR